MPMSSRTPEEWSGVSESDWAGLHHRVGSLESSVRIVAAGHQQLVDQMAEITVSQHSSGKRLDTLGSDLAENSKVTREILSATRDLRDVVITARTGGKFARWLAPTVIAGAAAIAVIKGGWDSFIELLAR